MRRAAVSVHHFVRAELRGSQLRLEAIAVPDATTSTRTPSNIPNRTRDIMGIPGAMMKPRMACSFACQTR